MAVVENTDQAQRSPSVQCDVQVEEQAGKQRSHGEANQGRSRVPAAKSGGSQGRRVRASDPTYKSDR